MFAGVGGVGGKCARLTFDKQDTRQLTPWLANLKEMAVSFLCCSLTAEWNEARCAPLIRAPVCPCVCVGVDGMFPFAYLK